jgi:purine-nucleoside phosphorylase
VLRSRAVEDLVAPLREAVARWDARGWPRPAVALISGSGLGVDLAPPAHGPIPLAEIVPFPVHAVEGHAHAVELLLPLPGRPVLYFRGRLHMYQGYDIHEVVFPVRLAALLGAKVLVLTNAAGGVSPELRPGDLVLLRDQINLTGMSPLRGQLPPEWGPRFPDMTHAFDPRLAALARSIAGDLGVPLAEGVYAGLAGPSYETPAEVRMLRTLGGDVTGMSTVLEVLAARHLGVACLGISLVSNAAAGLSDAPLDHAEVLAAASAAASRLQALLAALLQDPGLLPASPPSRSGT